MVRAGPSGAGRGPARRPPPWLWVFSGGLVLWALAALATFSTGDVALLSVLVLIGSFLVPVTFVVWAFGRLGPHSALRPARLVAAFVAGATLGALGAAVLENYLLRPSVWIFLGVGVIEEGVKLAALWLVSVGLPFYRARDGAVLGGAVGFGFAGLENAGYALRAAGADTGSSSLLALVETEVARSVLAPFGHGLWTAIVGAVLFGAAARTGRLRASGGLLGAYFGVVALHALWDSMREIAIAIALASSSDRQTGTPDGSDEPALTSAQEHLVIVIQTVGWTVITMVALLWLRYLVRPRDPRPPPSWPSESPPPDDDGPARH
ncbi:hypothetical protein AQ490_26430 [Wenjunlia vitaminophila]|uniref:PrsW family intramembrane metalloprotease n=1 Tax=Wenjunlia vitaminophila TaxID=76728 RepID=A0A0T6LQ04_WENVI|nr:PrsW family glutamic-type intramembrane protease [Wenjunlia vitaminophila]KRV48195.1 hypothetical protein AQ490_26430 [Wenjunlia vitaminophila]